MAVIAFDLLVAERVVDRAIEAEEADEGVGAVAAPELFTRTEQQAGLALGELLFALGVGLVLAGVATVLAPSFRRPLALWLGLAAACLWAMTILPAIKYPALPPGVESPLEIGDRQLAYLAIVIAGLVGAGVGSWAWRRAVGRETGERVVLALAAILAPAAVALIALPSQGPVTVADSGLLRDFRQVSLGGQLIFWLGLAGAGAALVHGLRRRAA